MLALVQDQADTINQIVTLVKTTGFTKKMLNIIVSLSFVYLWYYFKSNTVDTFMKKTEFLINNLIDCF